MRVILDECLPRRLAQHLPDHEVTTVPAEGLSGLSNGRLLAAIEDGFEAFVTIDANLEYQQVLKDRPILIVLVRAISNRLDDLAPLAPTIVAALDRGQSGEVIHVGSE